MKHTADVHKAVAAVAAIAAAAHHGQAGTPTAYAYRNLNNPTSGDQFMFRNAEQQNARDMSDRMFATLSSILGGNKPTLAFLQTGDPLVENNMSATPSTNTVNLDPLAAWSLIDNGSQYHSSAVNFMPHEMAHLRQTPVVFANEADREGGAQALADLVASTMAKKVGTPYTPGNYDGSYAPYVQQAQARGNDWLLGGQFGKPPVQFP